MTTPQHLSDRYELGEILGFGGMSEVHMARDVRLSRDVAIKVLRADLARDPAFYLRFRREAQNAAAMNHPSIVAVYDTGEAETDTGPLPYIVMEYVEGETLRDLVRREGPLPPRRAMEIIADVCAALDFSHRNGIVHRDMKPANVMLNLSGAVKVMDFGIARAIADSSSPMTQTAAVIGTAQYLSPEQARGEQVDARSDVYSVGCVLFEILTGEPPFIGDSPVAVAYQHVREDPRLPSQVQHGIPRELDSIVLKAMSKNPANRYQSAAEMRSDLIRVLGGQRPAAPTVMTEEDRTSIIGSIDAPPADARQNGADAPAPAPLVRTGGGGRRRAQPTTSRRSVRWIAAVGAALVAIVAIGAYLWQSDTRAKQVDIPDLSGKTSQEAQQSLQDLGFRVQIDQRSDSKVSAGSVITSRPLGGSRANQGTTIYLEVSTGPEMVQVPKLDGLSQQAANQALTALRLRLDPTADRAPSTDTELDHVIAQEPSAGSSVSVDAVVRITLGSGPEQVRVPNVVGQAIDVARPNLEDGAGFVVKVEQVESTRPTGEVVSTSPGGGSQAEKGSTVTVRVSSGAKIAMPDLSNQTLQQVLDTLHAAGWTGTAEALTQSRQQTLDPSKWERVTSQMPSLGTQIATNGRVSVILGQAGIPGG